MTPKENIIGQVHKIIDELNQQKAEINEALAYLHECLEITKYRQPTKVNNKLDEMLEEFEELADQYVKDHPEHVDYTVTSTMEVDNVEPEEVPDEPDDLRYRVCANPECMAPFIPNDRGGRINIYCSKACGQYARREAKKKADTIAAKLAEIKATYPAPTKRPEITREL